MIPKAFHLVALSPNYDVAQQLSMFHAGWDIYVWDRKTIVEFMDEYKDDELLGPLFRCAQGTSDQESALDLIRLAVVYAYGGVCLDPNTPISHGTASLWADQQCVVSSIGATPLAASPEHPFIEFLVQGSGQSGAGYLAQKIEEWRWLHDEGDFTVLTEEVVW